MSCYIVISKKKIITGPCYAYTTFTRIIYLKCLRKEF